MRRIISTTAQPPSIAIVQGAYEKLYGPAENVATMCGGLHPFNLILASEESVTVGATQEDWIRFQDLVATWRQQRGAMSSITEAAMCPAYQGIIGMGPTAVPFIFAQLKSEGDEPDQWFWALKAILEPEIDPVHDEDRGDFVKMAATWLEWAKNEWYAR